MDFFCRHASAIAHDSLLTKLGEYYQEFKTFLSDMTHQSDTFNFWLQYMHSDCMNYILYLAGKSGNWNLRLFASKNMMPIFATVNSTLYYWLLPKHIHDLLSFPTEILE